MTVSEILSQVKNTQGSNAKKSVLDSNRNNTLLQKVLKYALDPFTPFNIIKVPKVKNRQASSYEEKVWNRFFEVADACASRDISGNWAVETMHSVFSTAPPEDEKWMRRILKKHLAIGASTKTVNKVFPGLIPTFEIALAQKFEEKRLLGKDTVGVEPKLDGIRCFAIVENGKVLLYARSGKLLTNFVGTIGEELSRMGDGCYDGEIMGEDFIALMRQAYRKESVDVSESYLALFDFLPLEEWKTRKSTTPCWKRHEELIVRIGEGAIYWKYLKEVQRHIAHADYTEIKYLHDEFVTSGFEGAMIKDLHAPYKFGRGYEVMKLKAFHDTSLSIKRCLEGTGKHLGKLGSVVVEYHGVEVQVGSGFSDELREEIWNNKDSFSGRIIEIRYQEVTPDGSLRFPTFVCFRNDR
jgi:DNA ligase-1